MRWLAPLALVALFVLPAVPAAPPLPLRVAVIDTGIDASHPEFAAGQIVAWRDFTPEASATPQDGHGHGTATASLVAGMNAGDCGSGVANDKVSYASGYPLVIARVGNDGGAIVGSVDAAVDWAVAQGAKVISISIGSIVPTGGSSDGAFARARAAGALVVVSAGNGAGNAGVAPYPSWAGVYGGDKNALVVGGGGPTGGVSPLTSTTGNSDPEVVSWSDGVCAAWNGDYARISGTSFSSPLVAGMAARAMAAAIASGAPSDPATIERVVQLSATNNLITPYHREGLGWLGRTESNRAASHAAAGTMPAYAAQGPHAVADLAFHDNVATTLRDPLAPYRDAFS